MKYILLILLLVGCAKAYDPSEDTNADFHAEMGCMAGVKYLIRNTSLSRDQAGDVIYNYCYDLTYKETLRLRSTR